MKKTLPLDDENEVIDAVTTIVDNLVKYTPQKDIDNLMTLYVSSDEFQFIDNEGSPKNITELKDLYINLFNSLDYIKVLNSELKVIPFNSETAYCVWQGREEIKMLENEMMLASWIATIVMKKIDGCWKIIHFHATHF